MFIRGNGPLISVLIPTRNRLNHLYQSIDSLYSLAKDKSLIEFILRIDIDDLPSIEAAKYLARILPCRTLVGHRGKGYAELNVFYNQMATEARGDWLFIWNDDARMKTEGWDQIILSLNEIGAREQSEWNGSNEVAMVRVAPPDDPKSCQFPMIRRTIFEILGHISPFSYTDHWLHYLFNSLPRASISIKDNGLLVEHHIEDIKDKTKTEGRGIFIDSMTEFSSLKMLTMLRHDIVKLRSHLPKLKNFNGPMLVDILINIADLPDVLV